MRQTDDAKAAEPAVPDGAEALRAARQRVLADLAPPVQHEVNNVLTVLFANLESLKRVLPAEGPPQLQMERVALASRRLDASVRAYTQMARRPLPDPAAVNAGQALAGLEPLLRLTLGSKVALALETAPDLPAVRIDRFLFDLGVLELARDAATRLARGAKLGFAAGPGEPEGVAITVTGLPPDPACATLRRLAEEAGGRVELSGEGGETALRLALPPAPKPG